MNTKQLVGAIFSTVAKVVLAAIIILYVYKGAITAYDYGYRIFAEEAMSDEPGRDVSVTIADGRSVKEIGELLESRGLIRDAKLFVFQELLSEYHGEIKPGDYVLNTSMNAEELIETMAAEEEPDSAEAEELQTDEADSAESTEEQ